MKVGTIVTAMMDRGIIRDYAPEFGEPRYTFDHPADTSAVLIGDWWCRRRDCSYAETYEDGRKKVHGLEVHYPRVFRALEDAGCEFEWEDEWEVVDGKAYRTSADSYSWEPTIIYNENVGEYMVNGEDLDTWLEWAVNDPTRAFMSRGFTDAELEERGFIERQCDYESGWYGVEDNPTAIMAAIRDREPNADVLFRLSGVEQFRVTFCVYVRSAGNGGDHSEECANGRHESCSWDDCECPCHETAELEDAELEHAED